MAFPTDLEIARGAALKPLEDVAAEMGIAGHLLEPYGEHVMKIKLAAIEELSDAPTAVRRGDGDHPDPARRGQDGHHHAGLGDGLRRIGRRGDVSIRQASMGPTFGIKGGACGGGHSPVVPFDCWRSI